MATNERGGQQATRNARKNSFPLLLKGVQVHDGAVVLFAGKNIYHFVRYAEALGLILIFHVLKLLLAVLAENRTPAADNNAL